MKQLYTVGIKNGEEVSEHKDNADINEVLGNAILDFFPQKGIWYSHCFRKPKDLSMDNLPCNLRDDLWIAKMLQKTKLSYMSIDDILYFVETSPVFKEKRHEYEQKIVKWQIEWMKNGGEGWLCDDEYDGDFVILSDLYDLGFRKGVVDTLLAIGIDREAIEEGLEKNANIWRNISMARAFDNKYNSVFHIACSFEPSNVEELPKPEQEFKDKWIQMRKYEYYQRHKSSVDKYGVVESDMLLSDEELEKLKSYLNQKHNEREKQIKEYNEYKNSFLTDQIKSLKLNTRRRRNN